MPWIDGPDWGTNIGWLDERGASSVAGRWRLRCRWDCCLLGGIVIGYQAVPGIFVHDYKSRVVVDMGRDVPMECTRFVVRLDMPPQITRVI